MGIQGDHAAVGGVGVFADTLATQAMAHEFGYVDPWCASVDFREFVSIELVEGVDADDLDAGQGLESFWRDDGVDFLFGFFGAWVAVAEWVSGGFSVRLEANVVYGPAVDGYGGDAFRSLLRGQLYSCSYAIEDFLGVPAEALRCGARSVWESVHDLDFRIGSLPAEQGHTATLRAQIYRD